jgi:predicted site-specific integrase-resolvase
MQTIPEPAPTGLTPAQAATKYAVPLSTVYRWCQEGRVKLLTPLEGWPSKYMIDPEDFVERALDWAGINN